MSGFFLQGDTRLSLDGEWIIDDALRIAPLQDGKKFFGLRGAGSGEPVTGVPLHAVSHYGDDALDLNLIPAPDGLDATKLVNLAVADIVTGTALQDGVTYAIQLSSISPPFTNRVIVADVGGVMGGVAYGPSSTVFLGGTPPSFGQITDSHISPIAAISFSKLSGVAAAVHVHSGADITSGTVARANLPSQVAYEDEANTLSALQTFGLGVQFNVGGTAGAGKIVRGGGSGLLIYGAGGTTNHMQILNDALTPVISFPVATTTVRFAGEVEVDGPLNIDSSSIGVFSVTPVVRTSAYTQAYATASRTLAAYTADSESVAYTGAADGEAKLTDLNALRVAYENLRAFVESIAGVLNSHTDDFQLYGWLQ